MQKKINTSAETYDYLCESMRHKMPRTSEAQRLYIDRLLNKMQKNGDFFTLEVLRLLMKDLVKQDDRSDQMRMILTDMCFMSDSDIRTTSRVTLKIKNRTIESRYRRKRVS